MRPFHRRWCALAALVLVYIACATCIADAQENAQTASGVMKENLTALARLYGTIRWFHPSDNCLRADWNAIAIQGVLEALSSPSDYASRLEALFAPVAPTVRVFPIDSPDTPPAELRPPETLATLRTVAWEHIGLGTPFYAQYGSTTYESRRVYTPVPSEGLPVGSQDPANVPVTLLNDEIAAWVPLTLYADSAGTFPQGIEDATRPAGAEPTLDERATMLADAIVIWSLMQHFYPYFDAVDVDWDAQLEVTLEHILAWGADYTRAALKADLIVPLKDGHAGIYDVEERANQSFPELGVAWIDESLVVTAIGNEAAAAGVEIADVIRTIDGTPSIEAMESVRAAYSGSDHYRTVKGWMSVLAGAPETHVSLELETPEGRTYTANLKRIQPALLAEPRPDAICKLAPDVYYVDIARATDEQLAGAATDFASASGIIIDSRGYPAVPYWSAYFVQEELQSMATLTPIYRLPNQVDVDYRIRRTSSAPRVRLQQGAAPELVFLVDARAASAAEHQLSVFQCADIGTFVGAPTAGANGNINLLDLPSGVGVTWAGMVAQWPDGSVFHAVGIEPDISVEPTLQGISEDRDEVLEAALDYLRNRLGSGAGS